MKNRNRSVIVVGGGAGGMMAAGRAAEEGAHVILLEKTRQPGQKILISGKTRCNLTNAKDMDDFISMYGPSGRFLYRAFQHFFREDLLAFLKHYDVETKTERGGRIFPVSDNAEDVVRAFRRYLTDHDVRIITHTKVTGIQVGHGRVTGVRTEEGNYTADAVILATGGKTYPATGSTGDGYTMSAAVGHTIIKLRPALVPLIVKEIPVAKSMQGVSLRNVRLTAFQCRADKINPSLTPESDTGRGIGKKQPRRPVIESRMGEMMITHFGIGGPITLLMSLAVVDALDEGPVSVSIDLKPALDKEQLRRRLQRNFDRFSRKKYRSILKGLLPAKMIEPFIEMTGIPRDKPGNQINALERERLIDHLKSLRFNIIKSLPMSSAIVTAGGVSLKEIDPHTMASRIVKGLYFCGEVMDIDADTGGYNLQAAFSTGFLAGEKATAYVHLQAR
ncbi:MAG TPA: NAD(P)/FAD-dependent oxidoreductase [Syntrophales bacterium]|nr:NAD(P)/FAD-dependent oxidoreductase [Syntrophales bacterium]